jgi:HNH endonuclease
MRICNECKVEQQMNMFNRDKRQKDCVARKCKTCVTRYNRGMYYKHVDKRRQYLRDYGHRTRNSRFKKNTCEMCGFIPLDLCQLDVDHKDGNRNNNSLENLQTLCANCHRLKTKTSRDGTYKKIKETKLVVRY